ncbi:hypothetical protein [Lysinibacillus fusiformis]|uniref:hypothetical protein n=1 Tax=Lysinibacillus fusiformis TaxID=28031 RepID=UPI001880684D|nr:hypothetical protein [Lysinibacillus fusiformis]MBD8523925.1 hypothetical protein [Lysinibacillus fusiformis]
MAGEHLSNQKKYRIEELVLNGKQERADRIFNSDVYSPIFQNQFYHPEAEPDLEGVNDDLSDILNDLFILEGEFVVLAESYKSLLEESILKIDTSKREAIAAREKIMDMNMICNEDNGFFQVRTLTNDDFIEKDVINNDNVITAWPNGFTTVDCKIIDIVGNGIEGNHYVFTKDEFIADKNFTGNRAAVTDDNITTIYEYQKINADQNEPYVFTDLNFDGTEAYCTITLEANEPITSIKILSPDNELVIREVQVSVDNDEYLTIMDEALKLNKRENIYLKSKYIYESGIIAFPLSTYIKISLSSDGYTGEKIAFLHEHLE